MVSLSKTDPVPYRPLISPPRSLSAKFITLLVVVTVSYALISRLPSHLYTHSRRPQGICTPQAWAAGEWVPTPPPTNRTTLTHHSHAYEFLGFEGCASSREPVWHLGVDHESAYDRFPAVASWKWSPPSENCTVRDLDPATLIQDLVENGGWLMLGDSVTENHFFAISCMLYPHVRATPDFARNPELGREWPHNLYLNPASSLISTIAFPPGFDIETTPLITSRRVDLLYDSAQLDAIYHRRHPDSKYIPSNGTLFSEETVINLPPSEYMDQFTAPLPQGNYATMIVSVGGHWTMTLFEGLRDTELYKDGIQNLVNFFGEVAEEWAGDVQRLLDDTENVGWTGRHRGRRRAPRQILVKPYQPGHEDCHAQKGPWTEYTPGHWDWYNWNQIADFNHLFEAVLDSHRYPDIHYLPIDRPGLLRPDAHMASDCLHIMAGAGVLEGWTQYIWHYVTVELPGRVR